MLENCPKCGNKLNPNAKYCEQCGTGIIQVSDSPIPGHLVLNRKKSFYGVAIGIIVTINNVEYRLDNGDNFTITLAPGTYTLTYKVWCRRKKEVIVEVESGGEYLLDFVNDYLWGGFKVGKNSKLK